MPDLVTDDERFLCDTETEVDAHLDEKAAFTEILSIDTSAEFDAKGENESSYFGS